ncbi:MAG: hypothetical protein ACOCZK_00910 [Planctomycetota bacterium]
MDARLSARRSSSPAQAILVATALLGACQEATDQVAALEQQMKAYVVEVRELRQHLSTSREALEREQTEIGRLRAISSRLMAAERLRARFLDDRCAIYENVAVPSTPAGILGFIDRAGEDEQERYERAVHVFARMEALPTAFLEAIPADPAIVAALVDARDAGVGEGLLQLLRRQITAIAAVRERFTEQQKDDPGSWGGSEFGLAFGLRAWHDMRDVRAGILETVFARDDACAMQVARLCVAAQGYDLRARATALVAGRADAQAVAFLRTLLSDPDYRISALAAGGIMAHEWPAISDGSLERFAQMPLCMQSLSEGLLIELGYDLGPDRERIEQIAVPAVERDAIIGTWRPVWLHPSQSNPPRPEGFHLRCLRRGRCSLRFATTLPRGDAASGLGFLVSTLAGASATPAAEQTSCLWKPDGREVALLGAHRVELFRFQYYRGRLLGRDPQSAIDTPLCFVRD